MSVISGAPTSHRPIYSREQQLSKKDLTEARRALVELMQEIRYGEISDLEVREGEPIMHPPPIAYRDVALGRENGPHPARHLEDFVLKRELIALFDLFETHRNIRIHRLVVQAGLPLRVRVRLAGRI